jgi:hypothetical protein
MRPAWTNRAPDAILAATWPVRERDAVGRVVIDGPQAGPWSRTLASVVGIDEAGGVHWAHGDTLLAGMVTGFQSYPPSINDGTVRLRSDRREPR